MASSTTDRGGRHGKHGSVMEAGQIHDESSVSDGITASSFQRHLSRERGK